MCIEMKFALSYLKVLFVFSALLCGCFRSQAQELPKEEGAGLIGCFLYHVSLLLLLNRHVLLINCSC